jgi:hypothetical protein
MRFLFGHLFDAWRNFWIGIDLMVDDALDVFGDDE